MKNLELKAGELDLFYQDGFIRYVRLGDLEIIRMINHALRDHNWGTVPMEITDERMDIEKDSFSIFYTAVFQQDPIDFKLACQIEGKKDGSLIFDFDGIANSDFLKNRIGFTVLHPISPCKGKKVTVVHSDGQKTESSFPKGISPDQPFMDIRELHWSLSGGVSASLLFEGDIFETEDQRNWTDASYKTYCTPLGNPFPVEVKKGDKIQQKVTLHVNSPSGYGYSGSGDHKINITLEEESIKLPKLGIELKRLEEYELEHQVLKSLDPDYLRIELDLDHSYDDALDLLQRTMESGTKVELALFTDQKNPIEVLKEKRSYFRTVKSLLLFGDSVKTTPQHLIDLQPQFRELFPQSEIYAGTDAFFTELNRAPVEAEALDGITYSINPQVHTFDDQSLIETLEAQSYTVLSARDIYPSKKINISPVSFHMRWNPNATEKDSELRRPTGWKDKRQFSFFGACWFLISFKYLSESGVSGITYFSLFGDNGWLKKQKNTIVKSPIYDLRQEIKKYSFIVPSQSSHPLLVDVISFKEDDKTKIMLVNWTDKEQLISLPEAYRPIELWKGWDVLKNSFARKNLENYGKKDSFELKPNSLTHFVKEE